MPTPVLVLVCIFAKFESLPYSIGVRFAIFQLRNETTRLP